MWTNRNFDRSSAVSLHKALRKLKDTLGKYGIEDLVVQVSPSEHKVDVDLFDCDYYQFTKKDPAAMRKYSGRYMSNWSWGEETAAQLSNVIEPML